MVKTPLLLIFTNQKKSFFDIIHEKKKQFCCCFHKTIKNEVQHIEKYYLYLFSQNNKN
jgi:hypothetical protein